MAGRFRFSRKGVEFSGKGPEMFAGVVRAEFFLSDEGQKIVDTLAKVLDASVTLYDTERRAGHHVASGPSRLSFPNGVIDGRHLCHLRARINGRWTLSVSSQRRLHPDAESLAKWAATKLEPHVPDKTAEEPTIPPAGGGGGSGGAAEIGIPVWWARKARN